MSTDPSHYADLLGGLLDGTLTPDERRRAEGLLATHPQLREWFDASRRDAEAMREMGRAAARPDPQRSARIKAAVGAAAIAAQALDTTAREAASAGSSVAGSTVQPMRLAGDERFVGHRNTSRENDRAPWQARSPRANSSHWAWVASAAAAVLLIGTVGVLWNRGSRSPELTKSNGETERLGVDRPVLANGRSADQDRGALAVPEPDAGQEPPPALADIGNVSPPDGKALETSGPDDPIEALAELAPDQSVEQPALAMDSADEASDLDASPVEPPAVEPSAIGFALVVRLRADDLQTSEQRLRALIEELGIPVGADQSVDADVHGTLAKAGIVKAEDRSEPKNTDGTPTSATGISKTFLIEAQATQIERLLAELVANRQAGETLEFSLASGVGLGDAVSQLSDEQMKAVGRQERATIARLLIGPSAVAVQGIHAGNLAMMPLQQGSLPSLNQAASLGSDGPNFLAPLFLVLEGSSR